MRNIKLVLQYDGTNYAGYQRQRAGLASIQSCLEQALTGLTGLTGAPVRVTGAGRTDAGVHALGQTVNFFTDSRLPVERFPFALNSRLPRDLVVLSAAEVDAAFHARKSASSKLYRYTIYNDTFPSPFWRHYAYHWRQPLDERAMGEAARYLTGRHDFAAFRAAGSSARTTVREVYSFEAQRQGKVVQLEVRANGFLYHMVRIMAGTLLEVGHGRRRPEDVEAALQSRDRNQAGRTLPPHGLCLVEVSYSLTVTGAVH